MAAWGVSKGGAMSFWYNDTAGERVPPGAAYTGEETTFAWSFGLKSQSWFFDMFVDAPARVLGESFGPVLGVIFFGLSIAAGVYSGKWIDQRAGRVVGIAGGLVIGIYVMLVLYRTQHWAAFSMLKD